MRTRAVPRYSLTLVRRNTTTSIGQKPTEVGEFEAGQTLSSDSSVDLRCTLLPEVTRAQVIVEIAFHDHHINHGIGATVNKVNSRVDSTERWNQSQHRRNLRVRENGLRPKSGALVTYSTRECNPRWPSTLCERYQSARTASRDGCS